MPRARRAGMIAATDTGCRWRTRFIQELAVTDSVERALDKIGTTDYIFWFIETFTPGPGEKESGRALKAVCAVLAEEARRKKKL